MFVATLDGSKMLFLDKGSAVKFKADNDGVIIQDADTHLLVEEEAKEYATALN